MQPVFSRKNIWLCRRFSGYMHLIYFVVLMRISLTTLLYHWNILSIVTLF